MNRFSIAVICMTLISQLSFGQSELIEYVNSVKKNFHQEDIKSQFAEYDFTRLIIPKHDFLGFIGSKYRRIKIFYNSIQKDKSDPSIYHVSGVSVVGSNKCDFSGELNIESIHEAKRFDDRKNDVLQTPGFSSIAVDKMEEILNRLVAERKGLSTCAD